MEEYRDLISGRILPYSDDEYVRQAAERVLLERGWDASRVQVAAEICRRVGEQTVEVKADLLLMVGGRPGLLMRCARASLVSREKEVVAAARLFADPWVPYAMTMNGEDAELLDTASGKVLATGLEAVPSPAELERMVEELPPHHPTPSELDKAMRVYRTFCFIQCPGKCTV